MIGKRKNKRILIVGAGGFIGSSLTRHLLKNGRHVSAVVGERGLRYLEGVKDHKLAVYPRAEAEHNFKRLGRFEYVFNISGYIDIRESFAEPLKYELNKPVTTIRLIENCLAEKIINISTANVYAFTNKPLNEKSPVCPASPYAVSQLSADYYTQVLCGYHKIPFLISRIFNPYGPPNKQRGVISTIVNELLGGKRVTLYNPQRRFDFTYIDDIVEAISFCAFKLEGTVNIGSAHAVSLAEVYKKICFLIYKNYKEPRTIVSDKHKEEVFCGNIKLRSAGFKFKYGIDEGLRRTIRYFQESGK